jgi:hypothetical protein
MGIFSDRRSQPPSGHAAVVKESGPPADAVQHELCDRCHAAWAKVEVIVGAGSVFLCSHHYQMHRHTILAARYQVRAGFSAGLRTPTKW